MPALARILARRYGCKCSVFITTDPKTGFIEPGSSNITGLEALKTADLLVIFLRFEDFPDDQMRYFRRLHRSRRANRGLSHGDARVPDPAAGRALAEIHVEGRRGPRVFATTHGASEDLLDEGFRRMAINACLWAAGLEASIRPTSDVSFVGQYQPSTFNLGGHVKGVKPADLAG